MKRFVECRDATLGRANRVTPLGFSVGSQLPPTGALIHLTIGTFGTRLLDTVRRLLYSIRF